MAILNHGSTIRTADGGQSTATIVTASNIGSYAVASSATYYIGTTQNVFNRASGAQTLTGVSIDGNAATVTNGVYTTGEQTIAGAKTFNSATSFSANAFLTGSSELFIGSYMSLQSSSTIMGMVGFNRKVSDGTIFNSSYAAYQLHNNTGTLNLQVYSSAGGFVGAHTFNSSGNVTFLGTVSAATDFRAPIFYDSNNTAYYIDPASTSNLVGLTVANTITGSVSGSSASCSGNAATATILQTARNINGTSFNGSAAITTASWGTARTLTIGSTGKSVDGSAAVAWSLAEIGAAAIAQTMFIGTTSIAINRSSASQTLTGVSIDGNAATATNGLTTSNYVSYSAFSGSVTSTYGNFTTPGLIMGDAQYGFYVVSGNVYYKSASGGVHYWRNIANSANTMSLDNSGILTVAGNLSAPIFYDSNDTAYYVDPNSVSRLASLRIYSAFDTASSDVYANMRVMRNNATTDGMYIGYGNSGSTSALTRIFGGGATTGELSKYSTYTLEPGSFRSPIFYDSDDTTFYINAAGESLIRALNINGGTINSTNDATLYVAAQNDNDWGIYVNKNTGSATNYGLRVDVGNADNFGIYLTGGSVERFKVRGNGTVSASADFRAPIFYDSDNTGYYLDAASTSNLNILGVAGRAGIGGAGSRSTSGLTVGFTDNSTFAANTDVGDTDRMLSIVNESSTTNAMAVLGFRVNPNGGTANAMLDIKFVQTGATNTSGLHYTFNHGGSFLDRFSILSSGNVGIGTVSPTQVLDVRGNIKLGADSAGNYVYYVKDNEGSIIRTTRTDVTQEGLFRSDGWGNFTFNNNIGVGLSLGTGYGVGSVGSGIVYANGSVRAPIFYDSNNTAYYIDAAGTSVLNALTVGGNTALTTASTLTAGNLSGTIPSGVLGNSTVYIGTTAIALNRGSASQSLTGINIDGNSGTVTYSPSRTDSTAYPVLWGAGTSTTLAYSCASVYIQSSTGSLYANTFYDAGNTAYYIDPASGSNVNNLTTAGTLYTNNIAKNSTGSPIVINSGLAASTGLRVYYDMQLYNTLTFTDSSWNSQGAIYGSSSVVNIVAATATTTFTKYAGYSQEGGSFRAPLFYDSNDTTYYIDPANGGFNLRGGTSNRVTFNSGDSGIIVTNAEGISSNVRLGCAWGRPGIYNGSSITVGAETQIDFVIGNVLRAYVDSSSNLFGVSSARAPIFYDSGNTAYYVDPASTSNLVGLTVANTITGSISGNAATASNATQFGGESNTNFLRGLSGGTQANLDTYNDNGFRSIAYTGYSRNLLSFNAGGSTGTVQHEYFYGIPTNGWRVRNKTDNTTWSAWGNVVMTDTNQGALTGTVITTGNSSGLSPTFTNLYANIFYDAANTAYYVDPNSTSNLVGLTVANTITGSVSGNAATATNIAWTGITQATRTNYDLIFQPPNSGYAGFTFNTTGGVQGSAGYLLVRGTSDSDVYTAEGITLVADAGWLTLAQRTTASKGVRIMTGTTSSERFKITTAGDVQIVNGNTFTYNGNVVLHSGNVSTYAFAKSGSWAADLVSNYGYTRETGMQMTGGSEFVVLSKSGQGFLLVDGSYFAAEAGGFYSTNNSSGGTLLGFYSDTTTSLNFNTTAVKLNGNQILHAGNYNSYAPTLTGTGASGTWSISISGNSATTTLATKATRANGNFYIDDNYGNTVVGLYSANRYQGVFAMGDAYKLATDGTGVGNLYGIAWSHPNAGGAAGNLSDHGALILLNGGYAAAISSSIRCTADMRTPIYYDSNDTAYYIDPNSSSSLLNVTATEVYARNWFRNNDSGEGIYNQTTTQHFYSDDVSYWNVASSSGVQGIRFRTGGHGGTIRGYVYANDSNDVGLLNNAGNWRVRVVGGDYLLVDGSSIRGQIFYDTNNTAYYCDPAGTSVLNNLTISADANLELYKSQTVDMSNTTTYSTSNYYPVTISVPTEGCIIQIQNNLNSNVPSWSTHPAGFTLNLKWRTNGFGWGTTSIRRIIDQYFEQFTNQTICGGITQMGNSSTEVVWLRGGGQYLFKFSRNLSATAQSATYTVNSQSVTPTSTAQNTVWSSYSGAEIKYNDQTISTTNMYTPVLYDWNNTSYYVDPASTSNFIGLTVANTITGSVSGNAVTAGGLAVHSDRNNEANKIVRTDSNGYIQAGWINTTSGDNGTTAIDRVYASSDGYIRYYTPANFRTVLDVPTRAGSGASGTWAISVNGASAYAPEISLTSLNNGTVNVNNPRSAVYRNENGLGAALAYAPVLHLGGGDTMWQIQGTYGSSGNGTLYFRQGYNGSWGTWLTMLSSANYNSYSPTLTGTGASGSWGISVTGSSASCTGNAATATILQTARNINGTSFNGSAAITTATWGTARTITIGSTGKSVDGSANVSWSLAELGAAATNQTMFIGTTSVAINRTSASQTLTGISIDGSAASATTATSLNSSNSIARVGSSGNYNTDFQNTPAGTVRHLGDDSTITNNPGGAWWFLDNYRHSNGSNFWGTQVAWGWEDNANRLATRNITGGSFGSWVYYLNSSNYTSYAIARGGDTVTNTINFQSNLGTTSGSLAAPPLQAYATGTNAAFMSFHRAGNFAVNMGLDSDNVLRIGGWSAAANRLQLDMSGNLTVAGAMYGTNFIDSDNTAYFCNPASTSNLVGLTVANTITGSISGSSASCTGNSATVTNGVYTTGDQTIGGTKTFSSNAVINSVNIGRGANNIVTNTVVGNSSGNAITSGIWNSAFGYKALTANTAGGSNCAFGHLALQSITTGNRNNAFGKSAMASQITGVDNCAFGSYALLSSLTGSSNCAFGRNALRDNIVYGNSAFGTSALRYNNTGIRNSAFGYNCLESNTSGLRNSSFGYRSLKVNQTGNNNCAFGMYALYVNKANDGCAFGTYALRNTTTGASNSAFGYKAGSNITTGTNNSLLGNNASASSATVSNEITLGNASIATLRCTATSISSLSDLRDKADIEDINIGLSFVEKIRPVTFKWDKREWYTNGNRDGTKKDLIVQSGFIAQDLKKLQEEFGVNFLRLVYESNTEKLEATPANLLIPLIKAVQELNEKVKILENKVRILENR